MRIVVATGNAGKFAEIREILANLDVTLVAQRELGVSAPEETAATFVENALIKARHAAAETGLPAIADDSGLVVAALDGRPGVHSARYAGPEARDRDNVEKLLGELDGVEPARRGAHFHCVAVFLRGPSDPAPLLAEGRWEGRITAAPRGEAGFGYDPVFLDPVRGLTAAEMSAADKNAASHRGQAFRSLAALLLAHGVLRAGP